MRAGSYSWKLTESRKAYTNTGTIKSLFLEATRQLNQLMKVTTKIKLLKLQNPPTSPKTLLQAPKQQQGPTPLHSTSPSELEYELRESVAMSSILINISDIYGSGINPNQKSYHAWKHLAELYGLASDRARNMREEALSNCKLEESGKVAGEDGHIEKMRTLRQRANEAGAKINDARFITKLLDSFPDSWDPVITPMYGEPNLNKVIMNLTTHAERLAIREGKNIVQESPIRCRSSS